MTNYKYLLSFLVLAIMVFSCGNSNSATKDEAQKKMDKEVSLIDKEAINVLQFHNAHRCQTCLHIEKLTKETLVSYPEVVFTLINVDDLENQKLVNEFEAFGTSLFIYAPSLGFKKDLTDFAFMNVSSDEEAFKNGIREELDKLK